MLDDLPLNFKDYFFATFEIPTDIRADFLLQGGINSGRITLNIHIPGQTEFISLTIKSIIELENFSKGYKSCLYRLAGTFRNPPLVSPYFVSDTDLFSKIINNRFFNNSRPHLLCKAKIEDTTIFNFISLVQKSFKNMISATFNDKFMLDNYNQTTTLAIFQPNFLDTLNKDYNRSFDVFKKLTDPTQNGIVGNFSLTLDELKMFQSILKDINLSHLRKDLKTTLKINESDLRFSKI